MNNEKKNYYKYAYTKMKPIIRWTIGNVSKYGIDCLEISIKNFIKLYKDNFDYYLCHNSINLNKIKFLKKYNINFLNQEDYKNSLNIVPVNYYYNSFLKKRFSNSCWKLYPPRINQNVHEIFIDNDLIIYNKIPIVDEFLSSKDLFLMTEAHRRSYGCLDILINNNLNSGFIALPPNFEFGKEINNIVEKNNIKWENSIFEEQAVVAKIIENNNFKIIKLEEIYVCFEDIKIGKYGLHFVGLNNNFITKFWKYYKNKFL